MNLEKIRSEIEHLKQDLATPMPTDSRFAPSHEMRIRNNSSKLEELNKLFREGVRENTRVHLVYAPGVTPPNTTTFISNHNLLAKRLADFINPSVASGSTLNAYQMAPLNDVLDVASEELGLMTSMRPSLSVISKCHVAIQDYNHLIVVIESLLEHFLKNTGEEVEGHDMQAMYVAKTYIDGIENQTLSDGLVSIAVFVPNLSTDLLTSYKKYFTSKLVTISTDSSTQADVVLGSDTDLISYLNDSITRPTVKLDKNKKKK